MVVEVETSVGSAKGGYAAGGESMSLMGRRLGQQGRMAALSTQPRLEP